METFPCCLSFVWGIRRYPLNSLYKGQWRRAFMCSLICAWTNNWAWANNGDTGDFKALSGSVWRHYNERILFYVRLNYSSKFERQLMFRHSNGKMLQPIDLYGCNLFYMSHIQDWFSWTPTVKYNPRNQLIVAYSMEGVISLSSRAVTSQNFHVISHCCVFYWDRF